MPGDEWSEETVAVIMAVWISVEAPPEGGSRVRLREIWPEPSPWRWGGSRRGGIQE